MGPDRHGALPRGDLAGAGDVGAAAVAADIDESLEILKHHDLAPVCVGDRGPMGSGLERPRSEVAVRPCGAT